MAMTWKSIFVIIISLIFSANIVETTRGSQVHYRSSLPDISIVIVAGTDLNFAYLRNTLKSLYDGKIKSRR